MEMTRNREIGPPAYQETENDRLGGLLAHDALSLDLVSAYGGDRRLTEMEKDLLDDLKKSRGDAFYSDLLYAVTHQYFPPNAAPDLWKQILRHKYEMSNAMKRNIRIAVASLDYLSNLTTELHSATVISETHIADIVRLSQCDGLTGLFNHACCFQKLDLELRRYERYGTVVSLMMIDIDDFKQINDRFGHLEGDKILALMGRTLLEAARDSDICCRYGGEEFAIILPSTGAQEAFALGERVRALLARGLPGGRLITVSIGVASSGKNALTSQILVEQSDAALYQAKKNGKNRIVVANIDEEDTRSTNAPAERMAS